MIDLDKMIEAQAESAVRDGCGNEIPNDAKFEYVGTFINAKGAYKLEKDIGVLLANRKILKYFCHSHANETDAFIDVLKLDTEGKFIDP